jgi:hypothetical protein
MPPLNKLPLTFERKWNKPSSSTIVTLSTANASYFKQRGDASILAFFDLNPEATEPGGAEEGAERFTLRVGVDSGPGETSIVNYTPIYSFRPCNNEQDTFRIA